MQKQTTRFSLALLAAVMVLAPATRSQSTIWNTTYYADWSCHELGSGVQRILPSQVDWTGVTHVVYFGDGNIHTTWPYAGFYLGTPPNDSTKFLYSDGYNPDGKWRPWVDSLLAVLHPKGIKLCLTMQAVDPANLDYCAADSSRMWTLATYFVSFARRHGFDGIELDWEFWSDPNGPPPTNQVQRTVRMIRRAIDKFYTTTHGLFLMSPGHSHYNLYNGSLDQYVDMFNMQCYDFMWTWDAALGKTRLYHNSPLFTGTVPPNSNCSSINDDGPLAWVASGHNPAKLGIGLPVYGTTITLGVDTLFAPATLDYAQFRQSTYAQILSLLSNGGTYHYDKSRDAPYIAGTALHAAGTKTYHSFGLAAGDKFFGTYEDSTSLTAKVAYIKAHGFGGIMLYDVGNDLDPSCVINGSYNPMHRVVARALRSQVPPPNYPSGSFTALPASLPATGGTVTLSWASSNASSATIDQGVGTVALSGSTSVSVTASTTFTLTLSNAAGRVSYAASVSVATPPSGANVIYADNALQSPWSGARSWGVTMNYANTSPVYKGSTSIKVTHTPWASLQLSQGSWGAFVPVDPAKYQSLNFAVHGGSSGVTLQLTCLNSSGAALKTAVTVNAPANLWTVKSVPMAQLAAAPFIAIALTAGGVYTVFYLDALQLVPTTPVSSAPAFTSPAPGEFLQSTTTLLEWTPSKGATGYHLQVAPDSLFGSFVIDDSTLTDTARQAGPLSRGMTYYQRIRANIQESGWSDFSVTSSFTVTSATTPAGGEDQVPGRTRLLQNYPNPFNPSTLITYQLSTASHVRLSVYDVLGRELETLIEGFQEPGGHSAVWNAGGRASGVYFFHLTAGSFSATRRLVLTK